MGTPSSSHDHDVVARFLEQRATLDFDHAPIFYNDMASKLNFPAVDEYWSSHPFCGIFDAMDREDVSAGLPLRTALVVSKERGLPGEGFFKTMALLRKRSKPVTNDMEQRRLWIEELQRLIAHYQS